MAHLDLVALIVEDYDQAIDFFVRVLRFELIEDVPSTTNDGRPKRWVVVRPAGGTTGILLARPDGEYQQPAVGHQFAGRVGLFLRVDDFDAAYARMIDAGVAFVTPPRTEPFGRVAVFVDIAGNRWDLLGPRLARLFTFETGVPVLERTPAVLRALLLDLPADWITATEGPNTWSPFDVVGHLIHGERTNWMPRVEHLLTHGEAVPFPPFDRVAQFEASRGKTVAELLLMFADVRTSSLTRLGALRLSSNDLARRGTHPEFGSVTLSQLLATWVAHDLSHISQVVRVMGRQYVEAVGPWRAYLSMLGPASK